LDQEITLTVAIPAFNPDHRLLEALKQLHDLTRGIAIEVIIVQSGNPLPPESIRACIAAPLEIVTSASRIGPSAARNIALTKARGRWIHFHDADDTPGQDYHSICRALPNDLELAIDVICFGYENIGNSTPDVIRHAEVGLTGPLMPGANWIRAYLRDYAMAPYRYTLFTHVWSKIFRVEFLRRNGILFHHGLDQLEDVNFNLKCLIKNARLMVRVDQTVYRYRVNSGNANQSKLSGERGTSDIRDTVRALMPIRIVFHGVCPGPECKAITRSLYANTLITWAIRIGRRQHHFRKLIEIFATYVKSPIVQLSLRSYRRPSDADAITPFLLKIRNPIPIATYLYLKRQA
jgi:glycosyltransferase involved in cell wall biosynthesis